LLKIKKLRDPSRRLLTNPKEKMKLFDSHCHLDDKNYAKDLDAVIERARSAGVTRLMTIGVNGKTSARAVELAESHPEIYASVGVHPHGAGNCREFVIEDLLKLAENPKVHAWGEIGLDFNRMYSPREDQEKWFRKQLEIAGSLDLPMIFHERDSNGRFLEMLKKHTANKLKGVVHCFSGDRNELDQYLDLGLYIGITGILTIKGRGARLRELAALIPPDRLLVETDAPYLVPAPEKNHCRRNEPAFVKSVMLKLAEVKQEDPEQLAETIWNNTCRLYGIEA
jgi:TatD DNase family protein